MNSTLRDNINGRNGDTYRGTIVADSHKTRTTVVNVFNHFTEKGVSGIKDQTVDHSSSTRLCQTYHY